jgi:hypothetical protein
MMSFMPPRPGEAAAEPAAEAPPVWAMKLAALLHLEWCGRCNDWRDLGHTDSTPVPRNTLEEQDYPTIG